MSQRVRRELRQEVEIRTLLTLFAVVAAFATPLVHADVVTDHLAAISGKLDPRATQVLNHLDGTGRQLLAARSYLLNADRLAEDWSWSQSQIEAYQGSPAQQQFNAGIERVRQEFEKQNPGFTLFVNPEVRSIEKQIEQWNSNASVAAAAEKLLVAATAFLASDTTQQTSMDASSASFANFLVAYVPDTATALAAPGLSAHGQMRAVDFHIERNGESVAAPDTTTIESDWVRAGWRDKLAAAVIASGAPFEGPLVQPDEPWHYTYTEAATLENSQFDDDPQAHK